ncbi:hypothetical protein JKA74_15730 [Marivirga sp. S37H4]|uniref:Outer membrane protein beta-barrel domain-containing protein n=1 Tax=Marivirga aurantiaca TaxID=2802615 RepID=A0A934X1A7_9BACT|nr:hypothetical protein [Marivirga aurantiaca]MBK6266495.1 hypothetical protein [Marivirga aurantiaca]
MKRLLIFLFVLILSFDQAVAQENDPFDYGQEFLFGVSKSTNSGLISGGFFRYSAKKNDRLFQTFGIEVAHIRHPQERRVRSNLYFNSSSYYYGKEKYLLSTRLMYGYDALLFRKAEQKGVQINGVLTGGPSFGFISTYYLRNETGQLTTFSESQNSPNIVGPAGYFAGVGDMEMAIGLHVRASLLFEFGSFKSNVTGFEVGFLGEIFNKEIELVPTGTKNYRFYPAAFLSILFGSRK